MSKCSMNFSLKQFSFSGTLPFDVSFNASRASLMGSQIFNVKLDCRFKFWGIINLETKK